MKPIQEQFGQKVIDAFAEFARDDIEPVDKLEKEMFAHVVDANLRHHIAQVFYGARWIYKLGLALLTDDTERAAHVRAQLVDYGAIVEALLSDAVLHAIAKQHTKGDAWRWSDPDVKKRPLTWTATNVESLLKKQSFWWLIRVATEFGITTPDLAKRLHLLREDRNGVHIRQRASVGAQRYLSESKRAYQLVFDTANATKHWRSMQP